MCPTSGKPSRTEWKPGPNVPRTNHPLLERFGAWWMHQWGWRFEGFMPDLPRFVLIIAPHTSNWDFIIGLAAKWALGLETHFWGKETLFLPPLGWFMRSLGGIPVDRSKPHDVVGHTIEEFARHERMVLTVTPEGTRKKVDCWRSGFWHVAKGAGVPICCVAFDWGRRVIRIGPAVNADDDDTERGIARIRELYAGVSGRNRPPG